MNQTTAPMVPGMRERPGRNGTVAPALRPLATWMPWSGRNRPATPLEEQDFVRHLAERAGIERVAFRRSDVTAVLNALRCGLTVDELLEQAPGLQPRRLYSAYRQLEHLRCTSEFAWVAIAISGSIETFEEYAEEAAKLLPALVARLTEVARSGPEEFDLVLLQLSAAVTSTGAAAQRIERVIEASPDGSDRPIDLGRVLYDPTGAGLTSRPDYLPSRVGTLVPVRVAALLGESVEDIESAVRPR